MRYYLTTPIYYVNASPHIGHAYTTIAADVLVRHHKQRGEETFFLTGTDEHASKVYRVAEEQGLDPKAYVDEIVEKYWRELPKRVDAEYDFFIRTTDEGHKRFVQEFLQRIYDNGDIYQDVYSGLYCVQCEEFKSESELVDGLCPDHGIPPERIEETNWFFRLSAYQEQAAAALRRAARFRAAALPLQRGPQLHRGRPPGLQRQPRRPAVGCADPLGRRAGHLCLGRRPDQLPQRAQLRTRGRGSARGVLAARPPPARQGHPPLPLRLLAGAPARRRLRGPAAAVRPRATCCSTTARSRSRSAT